MKFRSRWICQLVLICAGQIVIGTVLHAGDHSPKQRRMATLPLSHPASTGAKIPGGRTAARTIDGAQYGAAPASNFAAAAAIEYGRERTMVGMCPVEE